MVRCYLTTFSIFAVLTIGLAFAGCGKDSVSENPIEPVVSEAEGLDFVEFEQNSDLTLAAPANGEGILKKIKEWADSIYSYAQKAARYAANSVKRVRYLNRALDYAQKIRDAYNDLAMGRDHRAEEAFQAGLKIGARDARRMRQNPGEAWIDIDWRADFYRQGDRYGVSYDGGYATGWCNEFK